MIVCRPGYMNIGKIMYGIIQTGTFILLIRMETDYLKFFNFGKIIIGKIQIGGLILMIITGIN